MNPQRWTRATTFTRVQRWLGWAAFTVVVVAVVLTLGVAMVAMLGRGGDDRTWSRWSNVGQAFGVLTAIVSGLALAALVVTFVMQFRELQAQRAELALQRELAGRVEGHLRRSAEAELRTLHMDLLKLAMNDSQLAAVWPPFPGVSAERNRQFLYANLVLQHVWLQHSLGASTEAETQSNLRYLLASPLIREYWRATAPSRARIYIAGTTECILAAMTDEICREHEGALACAEAAKQAGRAADIARELSNGLIQPT
jgi:multisubunit Na+/H+ antiporter MnhC subunit